MRKKRKKEARSSNMAKKPEKIREVQKALESAEPQGGWCGCVLPIKMAVINKKDQGLILDLELDDMSKKVYFCGGYSKRLFEILPDLDLRQTNDTNDVDLSKIQWAPTFSDFAREEQSLKTLIFLENDAEKNEDCTELGRIDKPEKIKEFIEVLNETIKPEGGWCGRLIKMAVINRRNHGIAFKMGLDYRNRKVEFDVYHSEKAFEILCEYGIIKPPKKTTYHLDDFTRKN